jgi:predicted metal-binding membrane protein
VARIGGAAILGAGAFQFSTLKEGPAMRDMRMG